MSYVAKFCRSVMAAMAGLAYVVRSEKNMRIHVAAAVAVIVAGFAFGLATWEWIAVVFCIGLVISAECVNTALERLADRVSLEVHPLIKQTKDCASAAVLTLSLTAAVVGCVIFLPKLRDALGW